MSDDLRGLARHTPSKGRKEGVHHATQREVITKVREERRVKAMVGSLCNNEGRQGRATHARTRTRAHTHTYIHTHTHTHKHTHTHTHTHFLPIFFP